MGKRLVGATFVVAVLLLAADPIAALGARLAYAFGAEAHDDLGDTDPGDVSLTGVSAGDLIVLVAATTTGADAPAVTTDQGDSMTCVSTLWVANLRRITVCVDASAAGGTTVFTADIPGGDTAVYDDLIAARYSDTGGFVSILDSDSFATDNGDDTEASVPSLTADAGGTLFLGAIHSLNAPTGDGMTDQEQSGFAGVVTLSDKGGTANATMRWTWTGASWAGAVGFTIQETAGGASIPAGIFNNPIRGGGLEAALRVVGIRPAPSRKIVHTRKALSHAR